MAFATEIEAYLKAINNDFNLENNGGSDRGVVLVRASGLDRALFEILKDFLRDSPIADKVLKGANAPLSGFSSRIDMCLLLGLIDDDEHKALHWVRGIRNEFAHQLEVDLNDQSMSARCANIYDLMEAAAFHPAATTPRQQFSAGTYLILIRLLQRWNVISPVNSHAELKRVAPPKLPPVEWTNWS